MNQDSIKMINLMFNKGESICVSPDQYSYHSVKQEDLKDQITLISSNYTILPRVIGFSDINLVSLNPIKGFRKDENVTNFRSFLVEMDDGTLADQIRYIKSSGIVYSMLVYSGNKSIHVGITLDEDLPDEDTYRFFAEWILKIMSKADQKTKNPSRSIRFAGNIRKETGKEMKLLDIKKRVPLSDLMFWLSKHPDKDPRLEMMKRTFNTSPSLEGVPVWVWNKLKTGIDESKGRNNEWYCIFAEFAKAGYEYEGMIGALEEYFTPERDFKLSEWKTIAKSACKKAGKQYG